jgi:hypothetical protein
MLSTRYCPSAATLAEPTRSSGRDSSAAAVECEGTMSKEVAVSMAWLSAISDAANTRKARRRCASVRTEISPSHVSNTVRSMMHLLPRAHLRQNQ